MYCNEWSVNRRAVAAPGVAPLASRPPDAPVTDLKAEREDEDRDCWDSKVKLNVQTSKKSISRDLYGPKVKPPVIKVRMGDGGGGEAGRELNV